MSVSNDSFSKCRFIYTFLGLGISLCLITCSGHIAAETANGHCLSCVSCTDLIRWRMYCFPFQMFTLCRPSYMTSFHQILMFLELLETQWQQFRCANICFSPHLNFLISQLYVENIAVLLDELMLEILWWLWLHDGVFSPDFLSDFCCLLVNFCFKNCLLPWLIADICCAAFLFNNFFYICPSKEKKSNFEDFKHCLSLNSNWCILYSPPPSP